MRIKVRLTAKHAFWISQDDATKKKTLSEMITSKFNKLAAISDSGSMIDSEIVSTPARTLVGTESVVISVICDFDVRRFLVPWFFLRYWTLR